MKKHPNAPAETKTKRKRFRKLTAEEQQKIVDMWNGPYSQKEIAVALDRSTGCITSVIKRITAGGEIKDRTPKREEKIGKVQYHELETQDLSSLPDTVLFKHSKEFFI